MICNDDTSVGEKIYAKMQGKEENEKNVTLLQFYKWPEIAI